MAGNYNSTLLTELFHEQSSRWRKIAERHVKRVHAVTLACVGDALKHVIKEDYVRREVQKIISRRLQEILNEALEELGKLCADEKLQPITYNHYFTDNIQKARQQTISKAIEAGLGKVHHVLLDRQSYPIPVATQSILAALQEHINVNMTKQACEEAKTSLRVYYKVSAGNTVGWIPFHKQLLITE